MSKLQDALDRYDGDETIPILDGDLIHIFAKAARLVANPLDELWRCDNHDREIYKFQQLNPISCMWEGRPGPCNPIAALIVKKPGDTP